jgi:hypothetical protein
MFTDLARRLADRYTVVTYDQRSHSRSILDRQPRRRGDVRSDQLLSLRAVAVREFDLTENGRTLHVYDTGAAADGRLAVFWHHGTPTPARPLSPCFPPPPGSASAGCRTTAPVTVDRFRTLTGAWGADPGQVTAPTAFLHGGRDRVVPCPHSEWLARRCPSSELRLHPDEEHISILNWSESALEWLAKRADEQRARLRTPDV